MHIHLLEYLTSQEGLSFMAIQSQIQRVRQAGEARRGTYMPPEDSVVYKMYRWWQEQTGYSVPRENFCHFYRVVLIWAPLRWVGQKLSKSFGPSSPVVLGVILVLAVIELLVGGLSGAWGVPPIVVGCVLAVVGVLFGAFSYAYMHGEEESLISVFKDLIDEDDKLSIGMFLVLLAGPAILAGQLAALIIHHVWTSVPVKFVREHDGVFFGTLVGLIAAGAVFGFLVYPFGWLRGLLYLAGGIVTLAVAVVLLWVVQDLIGKLIKLIKRRRHEKKRQWHLRKQALLDAGDEAAFQKFVEPPRDNVFQRCLQALQSAVFAIGDMLGLAFEAVRVTKWQICPLVEIPMLETATVGSNDEEID